MNHPMLGAGYRSFWTPEGASYVYARIWAVIGNGHNGYLDVWLELGFIGLGLFLVMFFTAVRRAYSRLVFGQAVNRLPSLTPDRRAKLTPGEGGGWGYLGLAAGGSADPGIVSDGGAEVRVGISGQARSRRRRAHAVRGFTGKPHSNRIIARCNPG
jgi:hypothetical protein